MNRYKAFSLHLLGSAVVLFLVFAYVRWVLYPGPLFDAASGADLVTIVILADLILGPIITLIIFNPQKRSLKFDMTCVLVFQIAFMMYGVWSTVSARPVYLAFVENRFHVVTANEIDKKDQTKAKVEAFRTFPLNGPVYVGTRQPEDQKIQEEILMGGMMGMGLQNLPEYFVPYSDVASKVVSAGKPAIALKAASNEDRERLIAYERRLMEANKNALFLPLISKKKILYVAIDAANGSVIEVL